MFSRLTSRAWFALLACQLLSLVAAIPTERAITCNGHTELCSRSFGNVTFVGAHDSYAVGTNNLAANQDKNVTQQLNDGIRLLQNQVLVQPDGLHLCHTVCPLYDAGLLVDYLTQVRDWLKANPDDVVSILFVNINDVPALEFAEVYNQAGLVEFAFIPSSPTLQVNEWPTLGSMIAANQRLVTFLDHQANTSAVPYIIDEFTNVWETAFDVTSSDWPCDVNRTSGDPTTHLYIINHFLDEQTSVAGARTLAPAKSLLNVTNGATGPGSLGVEIDNCISQHGIPPNFILVDFYEHGSSPTGSVFDVAAQLNGLPAPTILMTPPSSQADSASPSSSGSGSGSGSIVISSRPINSGRSRLMRMSGASAILVLAHSLLRLALL